MKNIPGGGHQQGSNQGQPSGEKKTARGFLSLGHAFFDKYKSDIAKNHEDKKIDSTWIRYGAIAAIIYTAIAFVLMFIGSYQVFISRDTERSQLRAYLAVTKIEVHCCELPDVEQGATREIRKTVAVFVKNGGQTPGSNVRTMIGQVEFPFDSIFPSGLNFNDPIADTSRLVTPTIETSEYMLPGDEKAFSASAQPLAVMRVQFRLSRMIIFGHIEDTSIFGEMHVTDFCKVYSITFSGNEDFAGCPVHNGERHEKPR